MRPRARVQVSEIVMKYCSLLACADEVIE